MSGWVLGAVKGYQGAMTSSVPPACAAAAGAGSWSPVTPTPAGRLGTFVAAGVTTAHDAPPSPITPGHAFREACGSIPEGNSATPPAPTCTNSSGGSTGSDEALSWVAAWGRLAASQGCAVSGAAASLPAQHPVTFNGSRSITRASSEHVPNRPTGSTHLAHTASLPGTWSAAKRKLESDCIPATGLSWEHTLSTESPRQLTRPLIHQQTAPLESATCSVMPGAAACSPPDRSSTTLIPPVPPHAGTAAAPPAGPLAAGARPPTAPGSHLHLPAAAALPQEAALWLGGEAEEWEAAALGDMLYGTASVDAAEVARLDAALAALNDDPLAATPRPCTWL